MVSFAWFMLSIWPLVTIALFSSLRPQLAVCVSIIAGYLLLPSSLKIDLPLLPPFTKDTIPVVSAMVAAMIFATRMQAQATVLPGWLPRDKVALGLIALILIGAIGTVATNGDRLVYGPLVLPGLRPYDGFSMLLQTCMVILPLLLGRRFLADAEGQKTLLMVMAVSALLYTLPAFWEVRMSPQLHRQIYGFFPHSFLQQMREGGFRPFVFLEHGLSVAIYMAIGAVAAAGLARGVMGRNRSLWLMGAILLLVMLVLTKSLGALIIGCILVPAAFLLTARLQIIVAACIAGMVLTYPALRAADLVPVDRLTSAAENIDPKRAKSFGIRVANEDALLDKISQRPLFGWGIWNRNRVFNEKGQNITITDGEWILQMSFGGWFRYVGLFGLLCWPIIGLYLARREKLDPTCALLALMVCVKLIDLIPNAQLLPFLFLMAGSLLGRLELQASDIDASAASESAQARPPPALSRVALSREPENTALPEGDASDRAQPAGPGLARPYPKKTRGDPTKNDRSSKLEPGYNRSRPKSREA